ncbi:MAG: DUF5615 family PIN-like protein [Dehalococcoidia bacterium]
MDPLRFLADESCSPAVIRALRADGHNVHALSEVTRRTVDELVIAQAAADGRILLTEDKDFGWLVFVKRENSAGVVLMRFPQNLRRGMAETVRQVVRHHGDLLQGAFVIIRPGVVRFGQQPPR